jgi:hypothetical protein
MAGFEGGNKNREVEKNSREVGWRENNDGLGSAKLLSVGTFPANIPINF